MFDHFFWAISGYFDLFYGLFPVDAEDGFYGPVENSRKATTALVVGTVYDPATPYAMARRLTADLGNARLLTMRGDGHTAYRRGSPGLHRPGGRGLPHRPRLRRAPRAGRTSRSSHHRSRWRSAWGAGALPALPTRPVPQPLLR